MTKTTLDEHGRDRWYARLTADGLAALRRELVERSVPSEQFWWGYDVVKIVDPDGNELLFPLTTLQSEG